MTTPSPLSGSPSSTGDSPSSTGDSPSSTGDSPSSTDDSITTSSKRIRVVDAKRLLADITLLSQEELRMALEALILEFNPAERVAILAFEQIAADLRAFRDRDPTGDDSIFLGPQGSRGRSNSGMDEVALRQLLYSPAVIPIITSNVVGTTNQRIMMAREAADQTTVSATNSIRVRAGVRKPAFVLNTSAVAIERQREPYRTVAIAAEQVVIVEGLSLDPYHQGDLIIDVLAGGVYHGLQVLANSGTFSTPVFSVMLAQHDPEHGPRLTPDDSAPEKLTDTLQHLDVHPYSAKYVRELQTQFEAALSFHLSGAGAYLALVEALRLVDTRLETETTIVSTIVRVPTHGIEHSSRSTIERFVMRLSEAFSGGASGGQIISAAPEEFIFALTPLLDIYRVGALGAYYYVLAEGDDSLGAQRFLERAAVARAEEAQLAALNYEIFTEIAQARHYTIIIEDKLGAARLHKITLELKAMGGSGSDDSQMILNHLSKREREIVTTEYANRRVEWEAQANNKCPHVRLVYRLRAAKSSSEATKLLGELSAYYKIPPTKHTQGRHGATSVPQWIHCKNCGFRVICPHIDELIKMEARDLPYDTIRTRLMKYATRGVERESGDIESRISYSYFCRICSECLAEFVQEDRTAEVLGAMGDLDDYIKKIIWIEAVNATDLVRFPVPVDPRQFASTAVEICHPLLLLAEGNLLKRGRRAATKLQGTTSTANDPFGNEETVDPRTHLYIALFVYAYILNLIRSSYDASKAENRRLGFEGVSPNAKISSYVEKILSTVLTRYSGLISQIEDITPEFIAERFREAYRVIVGEKGHQELTTADEAKIVVNEIVTLSPIYHYIAIAARVFGVLPIKRATTPAAAHHEFETVLGSSLPDILKDRAADSKSELVQMLLGIHSTRRGSRRVAVEYPRGSDPLYIYGAPEVNFLQKMFRVPKTFEKSIDMGPFDSLVALAESIPACAEHCIVEAAGGRETVATKTRKPQAAKHENIPFRMNAYLRSSPILSSAESGLYLESYRIFTEYTVNITDAKTMEAYQERLNTVRTRERGFLFLRLAASVKNYRQFGFTVSRRFGLFQDPRPKDRSKIRISDPGATPKVPLTYLYDENGLRHTWADPKGRKAGNIYIYSTPNGTETIELTHSDLAKQISVDYKAGKFEGPIHKRTLIDVRCSTCGVLLSETHTLDSVKAETSLRALAEFDTFFAFYDSRCPINDLHDFSGDSAELENKGRVCSKCGIQEILIFNHNSPKNATIAHAYYDKYLKRYCEQREVISGSTEELLASHNLIDPVAEALKKHRKFVETWKFDYSQLVQAADLIDVPVAAFETLGATEGREYPDVLSGTEAPPPPDSFDDPRLMAVDSDVRVFTTAYNRLRFVHRFLKPPTEVIAILEDAKVPLHEYEGLAGKLPNIYNDYNAKRLVFIQLRSPEDVLNFTIESLARMALTVSSAGKSSQVDWMGRLGAEFVQRMLREVIRSERLLAKHGTFNFKIFGEEDIGGGSLGGVDAPADDFGSAGEDVLNTIVAEGGEDGAYDPFSLNEVDMDEDSPNLD